MATKLSRLNVTFPEDIFLLIKRDAEANERSISNQVIWLLKQQYATRKMEADVFTPTQLGEGEQRRVPVFETRDQLDADTPSKIHERQGREKS